MHCHSLESWGIKGDTAEGASTLFRLLVQSVLFQGHRGYPPGVQTDTHPKSRSNAGSLGFGEGLILPC